MRISTSKLLPLYTRDLLVKGNKDFDLYTYMEDDIIIHDDQFFNKQQWFHEKTNGQLILMPHRYERVDSDDAEVLLVDGRLRPDLVNLFQEITENIGNGKYLGHEYVEFDMAANPHSGTFTINQTQKRLLSQKNLPTEGFIGPLETAATLTTMKYFKILKPSLEFWKFLRVEHGHPSFLHYINKLPHQSGG